MSKIDKDDIETVEIEKVEIKKDEIKKVENWKAHHRQVPKRLFCFCGEDQKLMFSKAS